MKYQELAVIYEQLENTSKRLEKTYIISKLFKKTRKEEIDKIILLVQGRVFPQWDETKLGVSEKLVIKSLSTITGISADKIEIEWKKLGDLGLVAEKLVQKKTQHTLFSKELDVDRVYNNIRSLALLEGQGSVDHKVKIMAEMFSCATPLEARYVLRTILEDLRVGIGSGSLRDALVWAFFEKQAKIHYDETEKTITPDDREEYSKLVDSVQAAFDLKADFGEVAKLIMEKGEDAFKDLTLTAGNPLNVMLYPKAKNLSEAFEIVGKPCAFEYKYDGFRMLVHKNGQEVKLFTRRLEEVSAQFPEIVKFAKEYINADNYIIDSEAVGYSQETGKYLPFQSISQRIKRKHDIESTAKEFPVELIVFDVLLLDRENLLKLPFIERRKLLEKIVKQERRKITLAKQIITENLDEAETFYGEALLAGEEGVMAKNLNSSYQPGRRVGFGVKVKPVMESLDLVIVGADWGQGKRSGWLTSFTLACRSGEEFLEIGKVGTGIKELIKHSLLAQKNEAFGARSQNLSVPGTEHSLELEEEGVSFEELTNLLKPHILKEEGKEVKIKPAVIIEVNYEEIQKSPSYKSGYALRFPRFMRLRNDKGLSDVSSIDQVEGLYKGQSS